MSFNALRAPARRAAAVQLRVPKSQLRSSFRRYTTETPPPPKASSNAALYYGLGAAALGGLGYFLLSDSNAVKETGSAVKGGIQAAKAKANFVPSQKDYQEVRSAPVLVIEYSADLLF